MNRVRDEEIAASVGVHQDLGPAYDDAIAAGLVERIGAEVDRRVDERVARYRPGEPLPAGPARGQLSWPQALLAFASLMIGAITSGIIAVHAKGTWPVVFIWAAIVIINLAAFRAGRSGRRPR